MTIMPYSPIQLTAHLRALPQIRRRPRFHNLRQRTAHREASIRHQESDCCCGARRAWPRAYAAQCFAATWCRRNVLRPRTTGCDMVQRKESGHFLVRMRSAAEGRAGMGFVPELVLVGLRECVRAQARRRECVRACVLDGRK